MCEVFEAMSDTTGGQIEKSDSEESRDRRGSFFRFRKEGDSPVAHLDPEVGPRWTQSEADQEIRQFLVQLAGDRVLLQFDDPIQLAQENDLLLLFGPEEEEAFARLALRFPEETVATWATLLAGGDRSEAFGPRSRAERRDEASIERSLKLGFRRRALTVFGLFLLLIFGFFGVRRALQEQPVDRSERALRFESVLANQDLGDGEVFLSGRSPEAEPKLVVALDRLVAVATGDGLLEDRVQLSVSEGVLPLSRGSVFATVFEHGGGQVALLGPPGWTESACVRASVVTYLLRPLDVVLYESGDACPASVVGPNTRLTCVGSQVLIFAIEIPQGEVELVEGGIGWAEAVRVGIEFSVPGWEVLSLRGTIAVPIDDGEVGIPIFGGRSGEELLVDFGDQRTGICTMT